MLGILLAKRGNKKTTLLLLSLSITIILLGLGIAL